MIGLAIRTLRLLTSLIVVALVAGCGSPSPTVPPTPAGSPLAGSAVPASPSAPRASIPVELADVALAVEVVVDGLDDPVDVAAPGDGSGRLFVVERPGRIRVVSGGELLAAPFLDIEDRIVSGGERGLLGLAFHPDFPSDPRLFVDYTDLKGDTVIAEFRLDVRNGQVADPGTERILIRIDQPFANHNGGAVAFGADGRLYAATGDGGSAGDPQGNGRRLDTLLAKVLRIDVDGPPESVERPYAIPDDNPFVNVPDARPEIWLTGLRNPWRMRFDEETGDLWIGDVGQGSWEEIDVAPAGDGGLDFGWNRMEGFHCYEPRDGCDESGLTLPVAEYGHGLGCAVIGGVVVRDPSQPALNGRYLFSDSCSGNFWLLDSSGSGPREPVLAAETGRSISSIGLADDGTVVATDLGTGELVRIFALAP